MYNKKTIQIRIDRDLHRQLRQKAIDTEKTITFLGTQMITYCLINNVTLYDEIDTIKIS